MMGQFSSKDCKEVLARLCVDMRLAGERESMLGDSVPSIMRRVRSPCLGKSVVKAGSCVGFSLSPLVGRMTFLVLQRLAALGRCTLERKEV